MIYTELTKKAMRIAFDAHKDQSDKAGLPYVFHPYHLAEQMTDELSVCVALLHDVVEDTQITFEDLAAKGITAEIIEALKLLTHDKGVPYDAYVQRIKDSGNSAAIAVKIADLYHNSDVSRLEAADEKANIRLEKYRTAIALLRESPMKYYQDDDTNAIVRLFYSGRMEIMRAHSTTWKALLSDNSYMREIFQGQGNNCLTGISAESAGKQIAKWEKESTLR